jgi:D-alanyl-D-alanine carboxypeptidase
MATDASATALNKMLGAFYKAMKDDNIIIANSYDTTKAETQDAIYSSGEAFEFTYFHDYEANSEDRRSIYGVQLYSWIYTNAYKYGFVTVGEGETNVFRYVGVVHSTAMKQSDLSFDEYLDVLKTKTPDDPIKVSASGSSYAIYYVAKDGEHLVPKNYEYTVSGNNVDGYVITVNLSKKVTN